MKISRLSNAACWVGSCAPATVTPIPGPSATPSPALQTQGPYLLFLPDHQNLTMMDAPGSRSKQIHLPNGGYVSAQRNSSFENAVSPDGKWLAYFTGSIHEPYNLALHLFNLQDQTTFQIARLIAPGFPENLERVKTSNPAEFEGCTEETCRIHTLELAFREGIGSLAWSPNSQLLAFAAQIDETIYRLSWRPDSLGIFLLTSRYVYYLSIPDGTPVRLQDCSPNSRCPNIDLVWLP